MNPPAPRFSEHPCFSQTLDLVRQASDTLNSLFRSSELEVELKGDGSPVTVADKTVDSLFQRELPRIFETPVISEESALPAGSPGLTDFWLVDPLDGTQNFVAGEDEFSIVVALIRGNSPQLGFVAAPAKGLIYGAVKGAGVWRFEGETVQAVQRRSKLPEVKRVVTSRYPKRESLEKVRQFCADRLSPPAAVLQVGSAYKSLLLLEERAEIVISYDGVSLWDLGGVQSVLNELGYPLRSIATGGPIEFNLARGTGVGGYFAYHPEALTPFQSAALVEMGR